MKKRILSLALAFALVFTLACPALAAQPEHDPIIVVPGYTATQLFAEPGSDERVLVWNPDANAILGAVVGELPGLLGGAVVYALTRRSNMIVSAFGRAANGYLDQFAMNLDGTRKHEVGPWPGTAGDFSLAAIRAKAEDDPNARYLSQLGTFCRRFEQQVGAENIFIFQYDWRGPTLRSAEKLREFINEVLALTKSKKVRLFGSSYGGQVCGAYLHDCAKEKKVSKIVMEFPMLGGSSMVSHLMAGEAFSIQTEAFTRFVQSYMNTEMKLEPLLKWITLKRLSPLVTQLLLAGLLPVAKTWGSIWDLVPAGDYEAVKAAALGPGERYGWEADCDRMHGEIMPNWGRTLREAQEKYGIGIRIVANTGNPHLVGPDEINSDTFLDVQYTTGAKALPLGQHGIKQSNEICKTAGHRHVSPGQDIDASAAWLPDHTWFVQGQFHGASYFDPYALELECALMMDPDFNTVFDDPAYPQFGMCRQPSESIALTFDGEQILIDNLSLERDVKILRVSGPELKFARPQDGKIAPGGSVSIKCEENMLLPGAYAPITVTFLQYTGNVPVPRTKTFDYTEQP
ncbi:MAG: hypothetical protein FWE98_03260 [Oscillospiraceae bacterium]|nr:hypothetical protein [Oscillospiraceae bacterium]